MSEGTANKQIRMKRKENEKAKKRRTEKKWAEIRFPGLQQ